MKRILELMIIAVILLCSLFGAYHMGYNNAYIEPSSDLFWIDSNRFHKDSIIYSSPIYSEDNEVIGEYVRVTYEDSMIYIEFLDREGYSWVDWKESWFMAFNEALK